ncbi:MAG: flagellar protein FliS [Butyribacter sp.]|nr:flagellar protein FliS [bacterium]MDY3854078.1 flagellar protein FliS [Butyribacter sp.]
MNQEQKKEYTARISQANRSELVVIIYELFLLAMEEAHDNFKHNKKEEGVKCLKRAEGFLQELMGSLDRRYQIAEELMRLYRYVYEQLIVSVLRQKIVNEETILEVMGKLKDAFIEVAKEDDSEPVMENAQQVYAGLTYGKSSLNEILLSDNETNRGYKA